LEKKPSLAHSRLLAAARIRTLVYTTRMAFAPRDAAELAGSALNMNVHGLTGLNPAAATRAGNGGIALCLPATLAAGVFLFASSVSFAVDNPEVAPRELVAYRFAATGDVGNQQTIIGASRVHVIKEGDTFLDLARHYDLGYNELLAANPSVDPWLPAVGTNLVIPSEWILPAGVRDGIVVNIPEMRLYYYLPSSRQREGPSVVSYPVGLGRQEWRTPRADFRVRGKTKNPVWVLPEAVKAERIAEKGFAEDFIAGGHPDNPLGRHRIELTLGSYAIHGTNKLWGVGMQVSHGCIRLYPEDIAALFPLVEVGGKGRFDYQPVKIGVRNGRVLVEVHEDIYGHTPWLWVEAQAALRAAGVEAYVDQAKLQAAIEAAAGIPTDVGYTDWPRTPSQATMAAAAGAIATSSTRRELGDRMPN
jgi:L,D-transpeptidase ErfK/SrfK